MIIRKATVQDCESCCSLARVPELYACDGSSITVDYLKQHSSNPLFLVAESDGICGFVLGEQLIGRLLLIHFLVVDQTRRSQGIGGLLIKEIVHMAKVMGLRYCILYAAQFNEKTVEFYKKNGFTQGKDHCAFGKSIHS